MERGICIVSAGGIVEQAVLLDHLKELDNIHILEANDLEEGLSKIVDGIKAKDILWNTFLFRPEKPKDWYRKFEKKKRF